MGFFGRFVFSGGEWGEAARTSDYLVIDIDDSSVATVEYAPKPDGAHGRCFLGLEPRHYYDDEAANQPVDVQAEARGLSAWARQTTGSEPASDDVQACLADPEGGDPEAAFVEDTARRLILLLGLPVPDDLPGS